MEVGDGGQDWDPGDSVDNGAINEPGIPCNFKLLLQQN